MPKRKRQRRPLTLRTPAGLSPLQKAALKEARAAAEIEAHARLLKAPRYASDVVRPDTIEGRERLRRVARGLSNNPPPKDKSGPRHREALISFVKRFDYTRFEKEICDVWRHWVQHSDRVLDPSDPVRPWIPRTEWDLVEENARAEGLSGEQYLDREALKELHIYCRKHGIPLEPGPEHAVAGRETRVRGKGRGRRRRMRQEPRPLTPKQTEAMQIVGECEGDLAEAARKVGICRKSLAERYSAALKKIGLTAAQYLKPKTVSLPRDRRGQVAVAAPPEE
jgi:predicted DNA-binding protein (UPF0251 family)